MTTTELKYLLDSKQFHHATYRCLGTLWEGLWIYVNKPEGFRGFESGGCFYKDDPALDAAIELVKHTGVSVGSYGRG